MAKKCLDCGVDVSPRSKRCKPCAKAYSAKENKIRRKEIRAEYPDGKVLKKYGIVCRAMSILASAIYADDDVCHAPQSINIKMTCAG